MKKAVLTMTLGLLASMFFGGVALGVVVVDQNSPMSDSAQSHESYSWADSAAGEAQRWYEGQSFTVGRNGELSKLVLPLWYNRGTDTQVRGAHIRIYQITDAGLALRTSVEVHGSNLPTEPNTGVDIPFPEGSRVSVRVGEVYVIAIEPEEAPFRGSRFVWAIDNGPYPTGPYPGGNRYVYDEVIFPDGGWNTGWVKDYGEHDHGFTTYVDAPDTDSDGVPDDVDRCPDVPGPADNGGCPLDPDTTPPTGSIRINGGDATTTSRGVALRLPSNDPLVDGQERSGVVEMKIKNENRTFAEVPWQPKTATKAWTLSAFAGQKTVSVRYRDAAGNVSPTYSDSIIYRK